MPADDGLSPLVGEAGRRLDAIRRALLVEMVERLRRLATKDGELAAEKDALDNARRIRTQVLSLIREQGMPAVIGTAEAKVAEAVDQALRGFSPSTLTDDPRALVGTQRFTLDPEAKASIERSVSGVLDDVAGVFGEAQDVIRKAIDVGLNTAAPLQSVIEEASRALDTSFSKAAVGVETAIRGAARKTLVMQAERAAAGFGEEIVYIFLGPSDSKTREFCRRHVDKAYTLKALKRLDNGMGLPVESFVGGHSCRHVLSPAARSDAEAEGYPIVE